MWESVLATWTRIASFVMGNDWEIILEILAIRKKKIYTPNSYLLIRFPSIATENVGFFFRVAGRHNDGFPVWIPILYGQPLLLHLIARPLLNKWFFFFLNISGYGEKGSWCFLLPCREVQTPPQSAVSPRRYNSLILNSVLFCRRDRAFRSLPTKVRLNQLLFFKLTSYNKKETRQRLQHISIVDKAKRSHLVLFQNSLMGRQ